MRIWDVPVQLMCGKHLRGEHVECHMLVGWIQKGMSLKGFVADGLVDPRIIQERHDDLAVEMVARGGNHNSPLPAHSSPGPDENHIDGQANIQELARRCADCYDRIRECGYTLPFPRGGDKVFKWEDNWYVQFTGQWLTTKYSKREHALKVLETMRRNMTLERQGRT